MVTWVDFNFQPNTERTFGSTSLLQKMSPKLERKLHKTSCNVRQYKQVLGKGMYSQAQHQSAYKWGELQLLYVKRTHPLNNQANEKDNFAIEYSSMVGDQNKYIFFSFIIDLIN